MCLRARKGVGGRREDPGRKGDCGGGFTLIELLVVISIISLLMGILLPVLGQARRQARTVLGMNNQRQIASFLEFYALDNDGRYPESVATLGTGEHMVWQEPTMLTGFNKRSPKLHRSLGRYLRDYCADSGVLFCPNAPRKYKYLQDAWDAGEVWDNPDTGPIPDSVVGVYCLYWNYLGYIGGRRGVFRGPSGPAGRPGESRLLVSDYFGYDHWRSQSAFGSCEKFRGASIAEGTEVSAAFWSRPGDRGNTDSLGIELSACYSDGHVERYRPSDTFGMWVSFERDGSKPFPESSMWKGDFYLPRNALR